MSLKPCLLCGISDEGHPGSWLLTDTTQHDFIPRNWKRHLCRVFPHRFKVFDPSVTHLPSMVRCIHCGVHAPKQDCKWCDRPMSLIKMVDEAVHEPCFRKETLSQVFGGGH